MNMRKLLAALGSAALSLGAASPVLAADEGGSDQLEAIVVTAQKRAQNLQAVPISVTAVTAAALENSGVTSVGDLSNVVSGLVIQSNSDNFNVYLRGIGNPASTVGNESSVGSYIDGVYYSRLAPGFFELNNIQRVEVLKGPQGTLFGRNADAGLIQIITRDPTQTPTLHADAGYGNFGTFTSNVYGSMGLGEKIAADISIHGVDMTGGWGRNLYNGDPFGWANTLNIRSKWVVLPADATKITVTFDYSKSSNTEGEYGGLQAPGATHGNALPPNGFALPNIPFYDADVDGPTGGRDISYGMSIKLDQDFSFAKFVSISAYRRMTGTYLQDADFTPQPYFDFDGQYLQRQVTQEFQLSSVSGRFVDWTVGLFYMNLEAQYDPARFSGYEWQSTFGQALQIPGGILPGGQFDFFSYQTVNSYAAYTQETFHILPDTDLTAGVRYTEDRVEGSGHNDIVSAPLGLEINTGSLQDSRYFEKVTYRAALDHHFTEDLMGYVSANRGFKAGVFNLLPFTPTPVNPEVLDAYEIGFKSELLDHHLRVNVAAFYDKVRDLQVQTFVGPTLVLVNAGAARSKGFDLDVQANVTDRLTARFSGTYLDAYYSSFDGAPYSTPAAGGIGTVVVPFDASGKTVPNAPRNSFSTGATYKLPSPVGDWLLAANYAFTSTYWFNPDGEVRNKAFGLLDARVKYSYPAVKSWSLALWGKNLTDRQYILGNVEEGSLNGSPIAPGAPRTYGFTLSYDF